MTTDPRLHQLIAADRLQVDDRPFVRQEPESREIGDVGGVEQDVAARAERMCPLAQPRAAIGVLFG